MTSTDSVGAADLTAKPSLFVRVAMRPMTRVFNPLIRKAAGRKHLKMAAKIQHRGRRSGRIYVTPASARLYDGRFWVPLTFGTESDWCQNVLAAGGCTIRWKGTDYEAIAPVIVDRSTALSSARPAFRGYERAMMRLVGIKRFLRLDVV
jgi:hypothetical protein